MKRALTAAVFGGLMIFAAPHGAWADRAPDHGDCGARTEQSAEPTPDCAGQPEGAHDADGHGAPDGSDRRRENHDGDDGTILF